MDHFDPCLDDLMCLTQIHLVGLTDTNWALSRLRLLALSV